MLIRKWLVILGCSILIGSSALAESAAHGLTGGFFCLTKWCLKVGSTPSDREAEAPL